MRTNGGNSDDQDDDDNDDDHYQDAAKDTLCRVCAIASFRRRFGAMGTLGTSSRSRSLRFVRLITTTSSDGKHGTDARCSSKCLSALLWQHVLVLRRVLRDSRGLIKNLIKSCKLDCFV